MMFTFYISYFYTKKHTVQLGFGPGPDPEHVYDPVLVRVQLEGWVPVPGLEDTLLRVHNKGGVASLLPH